MTGGGNRKVGDRVLVRVKVLAAGGAVIVGDCAFFFALGVDLRDQLAVGVTGGGDRKVSDGLFAFIKICSADGAVIMGDRAVLFALGVDLRDQFAVIVGALEGRDLFRGGIVREILFADGAVPVCHVAGGKAGGRFGGDFAQDMAAERAVFRSAALAGRLDKAGRRAAVAVIRDGVVGGIRVAVGTSLGVGVIAVGFPIAVDVARLSCVVAL